MSISLLRSAPALVAALVACSFAARSGARRRRRRQGRASPPPRPKAKAAPAPVAFAVPDAAPEQVKAAELVYYGVYDCEFQQTVNISAEPEALGLRRRQVRQERPG